MGIRAAWHGGTGGQALDAARAPRRGMGSRLAALVLAILFLGGVGGVADVDALIYHAAAAHAVPNTAHYEPAGASNHHTDHCLLALRIGSGRRQLLLRLPVRFEGIPRRAATQWPAPIPRTFYPGLHQESRAPPLPLV